MLHTILDAHRLAPLAGAGKTLRRKGAEIPGYVFGILRHGTTAGVLRLCVLASVLIIIPLSYVAAQTEPTDDEVNAIAKQLYCPVCENVPLDVCGTQACAQWRATIREQLSEGRTADEIKQYFAAQYGDRVLAEPPARGLNVVFWVLPPLAVLGGAFFVWRFLQRERAEADASDLPADPAAGDDEYAARLEQQLDERR